MDRDANHYDYLGIPVAASHNEVYAALEDLIRQANALSYTSPERARELWARIRRVRADLLTHPRRREAYDAELLRGLETPLPALALALSEAAEEATAAGASIASWRPAWLVTALLSGALVAVLVASLILSSVSPRTQHQRSALQPPAMAMSVQGSTQAGAYMPDRPIQLRWSGNAHATRFRIQLAAADGTLAAATAFRRPVLTRITYENFYRLHLVGGRLYAWRIQTYAHGRWQPFGPPRFFYVARPPASRPLAGGATPRRQRPARRTQRHSQPVQQAAVVRSHRRHAFSSRLSPVRSSTVPVSRSGETQPVTVAYVPPRPAARPARRAQPARRTQPTGPSRGSPGRPSTSPPASAGSSGRGPNKPPSGAPHPRPPSTPPPNRPPQPTPPPPSTSAPGAPASTSGGSAPAVFGATQAPAAPAPTHAPVTGPKAPPPTSSPATPPPVSTPSGTGSPPPANGEGQPGHPAHPAHPAHPEHPAHPVHPAHP